MKCPKCGHEQADAPQCSACGIIIEKYLQRQKERHQSELYGELVEEAEPAFDLRRIGLIVVAVAGLAALAGWLALRDGWTPEPVTTASSTAAVDDASSIKPTATSASAAQGEIGRAREATVLVKTAWSTGAGFFVTADCDIVTNRHVVEADEAAIEEIDVELNQAESALAKLQEVIEARREQFLQSCSDCSDEAYQRIVGTLQDQHEEASQIVDEYRRRLDMVRFGDDLAVVMSDGSEHDSHIERSSEDADVALLRIDESDCTFLEPGDESALEHGDKLYAIGSPAGLRHSVTAGVFSGYRGDGSERLIQTDAPINPGNSGGPLVDETGRVVGISTMTLLEADGIGFAIPFSSARRELELE